MSGIAIAGLAITVGTTTASFIQANKQKNLQENAEKKAEQAMKDARAALGVNYFEDLAINKEAYELERDATLQAQAGALQALQESGQRGVAGGVGRLAIAGQQQQAKTRTAMAKELGDLEKLTAQEESRLRDLGVQLDLEEVAGAQQAAAQAQEMRAAKIGEGIQGIGSIAQQGMSMVPLYQQDQAAQAAAFGKMAQTTEGSSLINQTLGIQNIPPALRSQMEAAELPVGASPVNPFMTPKQFRGFKRNLTPQQRQTLMMNPMFADAYGTAIQTPMLGYNQLKTD